MKNWFSCACTAVAFLALGPGGPDDAAAATTIMGIGDSITKGQGSFETGGYRMYLDQQLAVSFQFIGKRRDEAQPERGDWQYHNGYGGYQAASNADPDRSILKRFQDDGLFGKSGRPDVILLHVGTNTIGNGYAITPAENYAGNNSDRADTQLYRLLEYIGNTCPTTKIILANIIPKVRATSTATSEQTVMDTFRYNFGGADGEGGIPGVLSKIGSAISSRVSLANMFQINLSSIGRADLIGNARVDPDNDGIVDWVLNFDEFNINSASGMAGYNQFLLSDGVHPTALGYELMAAQWYQAMRSAGVVVNPTPTAAAAGLAMVFLGAGRRRRAA